MIDDVLKQFSQIQNWDNAGLTAVACLGMGYLWKICHWKWFPNDSIPAVVCLTGIFLFISLSGHNKVQPDLSWHIRAGAVGFVIGFAVVLLHNYALKKIENVLATKFGFVATILGKETELKP